MKYLLQHHYSASKSLSGLQTQITARCVVSDGFLSPQGPGLFLVPDFAVWHAVLSPQWDAQWEREAGFRWWRASATRLGILGSILQINNGRFKVSQQMCPGSSQNFAGKQAPHGLRRPGRSPGKRKLEPKAPLLCVKVDTTRYMKSGEQGKNPDGLKLSLCDSLKHLGPPVL